MILQRIRIIVVDAGFEPGTSAPEVWCAVNKPPHLLNKPPHLPLPTYLYLSTYISHNMSNCPCLLSQNVPVFSHNMSYFFLPMSLLTKCPCLLSQFVPVFSHNMSLSSLTKCPCLLSQYVLLSMSSLTKCPCLLSQYVLLSMSLLTKCPCLLSQYFF